MKTEYTQPPTQYGLQSWSDDGYEEWGTQLAITIPKAEIARLARLASDEEDERGLVAAINARLLLAHTMPKGQDNRDKINLVALPFPEMALATG